MSERCLGPLGANSVFQVSETWMLISERSLVCTISDGLQDGSVKMNHHIARQVLVYGDPRWYKQLLICRFFSGRFLSLVRHSSGAFAEYRFADQTNPNHATKVFECFSLSVSPDFCILVPVGAVS